MGRRSPAAAPGRAAHVRAGPARLLPRRPSRRGGRLLDADCRRGGGRADGARAWPPSTSSATTGAPTSAWALAAWHPDRVRSLTAVSVPHPAAYTAPTGPTRAEGALGLHPAVLAGGQGRGGAARRRRPAAAADAVGGGAPACRVSRLRRGGAVAPGALTARAELVPGDELATTCGSTPSGCRRRTSGATGTSPSAGPPPRRAPTTSPATTASWSCPASPTGSRSRRRTSWPPRSWPEPAGRPLPAGRPEPCGSQREGHRDDGRQRAGHATLGRRATAGAGRTPRRDAVGARRAASAGVRLRRAARGGARPARRARPRRDDRGADPHSGQQRPCGVA